MTRQIRVAYWTALLIISAMVTASYILVAHKLSEHKVDQEILTLVGTQETLSQRILVQANQVDLASPETRAELLAALDETTARFERNHDRFLRLTDIEGDASDGRNRRIVEPILFEAPHHLDHFTSQLVGRARRFLVATQGESGTGVALSGYSARSELAILESTIATAVLGAYDTLRERFVVAADERISQVLHTHRTIYYLTIVLLILVALGIFRPMANTIGRRTHELVAARNSMAFIAAHDALTGLRNRAFLVDHFDSIVSGARQRRERLAVLQLDLDGFKQINDTLGHAAGDFVLAKTAERIRTVTGPADVCVRLGGDEFVIILLDVGTRAEVGTVAHRVLDAIGKPLDFEGVTVHCTASAGLAIFPMDANRTSDLLVHADLALYEAKRNGINSVGAFSEGLRRELEHRQGLERDLRIAIAQRDFEVHYQPQISLSSGAVVGVEALVRWRHGARGTVSPAEFIPIAEKTGLMAQIGRIIIDKAIREAAAWHREGIRFGRLAVNVSGSELRDADFTRFLFDTIHDAGLPYENLSLEIVESVILDDEKTGIAATLRQIRAAGIHLELDDFGTGYASLSHVNPAQIDRLKIDRRFVRKIDSNGDNAAIVKAISDLARSLGIATVAEGAETEEEIGALVAIGCDHVQGYLVAMPMPEREARLWLAPRGTKLLVIEGRQHHVA